MKRFIDISFATSRLKIGIICLSYIMLFCMICSCSSNEKTELIRDIFTLREKYPEGDEEHRAKAVGISYYHDALENFFIKGLLLTPEEAKLIINQDGTINIAEFKKKFFRDLILYEQLIEALKQIIGHNSSLEADSPEIKKLFDLVKEESGRSNISETQVVTILSDGLRSMAGLMDRAAVAERKYVNIVTNAGIKERGETDLSKIERREWSLLPSEYLLDKHNHHSIAYMYYITHQPVKIDIKAAYKQGDFREVQFDCEVYTGENKDIRYLYASKMCRNFIYNIVSQARKCSSDADDGRGAPNNSPGLSYYTSGAFNAVADINLKNGVVYKFDLSNINKLKLHAFKNILYDWVHKCVYTDGLNCDQILEKLKTLKTSDI
jgi:hypothetical protein